MEIKKIEEVPIKKNNFEPLRAILIIIAFMLVIWGIWFTLSLRQSGTDNKTTNNDINSSKSVLPTKKTPTGTSLIVTDSFYKNYVKITKTDSVKENYPKKKILKSASCNPI